MAQEYRANQRCTEIGVSVMLATDNLAGKLGRACVSQMGCTNNQHAVQRPPPTGLDSHGPA